jgi:hypothetical protein
MSSEVTVLARPRPATDDRYIPIREAEQLLGLSRNSVLRRVKLGLLIGYADPDNGYYHVSRASVEEALRRRKVVQELAEARLPGSQSIEDEG